LGDVHAGDSCKVKGFKGHLGGGFSNALSSECSNSFSGLDDAAIDLFDINPKEQLQLQIGDPMKGISKILLILFIFTFDPQIIFLQILRFLLKIFS
jgi:hypothetical protein